jgi:plasmid stabilization system protein ParE
MPRKHYAAGGKSEMHNVRLTELAKVQMEIALEYAFDYYFLNRATKFEQELAACFQQLESGPYFYQQCLDEKLHAKRYRRAVVQDFIVVYSVDDDAKTVYIVGIFHGKQNYTEYI